MVCSNICFLFLVFAMVQIQMRWKRDTVVRHNPWRIAFKGHTQELLQKTEADIIFDKQKISYGEVPILLENHTIHTTERTEVELIMDIELNGPPLSFHRVILNIGTSRYTVDVFIPYSAKV